MANGNRQADLKVEQVTIKTCRFDDIAAALHASVITGRRILDTSMALGGFEEREWIRGVSCDNVRVSMPRKIRAQQSGVLITPRDPKACYYARFLHRVAWTRAVMA